MKIEKLTLLLMLLACLACGNDDDDGPDADFVQGEGMFFLCEGQFQQGNASVDYYNRDAQLLQESVFESENGGMLGDVLQSLTIDGDRGYLVVNNSGKIEVVDMDDFSSTGQIDGFLSPRFMQIIDDDKAYVSDLFMGAVHIVDLNSMEKSGTIQMLGQAAGPTWTEQMVMANGKVYVAFVNYDHLMVIDPATDEVIDSIPTGDGPSALEVDSEGSIWVLSIGDFIDGTDGSLSKIDPLSDEVIATWPLGPNTGVGPRMEMTPGRDTLLYLYGDLYKMPVNAGQLPGSSFIEAGMRSLYGLGVDPQNGDVFLADAGNFNQRSTVFVYTKGGEERLQLMTGFNCNGIVPY